MNRSQSGFTLIELIAVMIVIGVLSITLMSRMNSVNNAGVQEGRDSLIAAFFFAQQTAMARSTGNNIGVVLGAKSINVTENGNSLIGYPITFSGGVNISPVLSVTYDKLGRTNKPKTIITITHNSGSSASITLEASGYVY